MVDLILKELEYLELFPSSPYLFLYNKILLGQIASLKHQGLLSEANYKQYFSNADLIIDTTLHSNTMLKNHPQFFGLINMRCLLEFENDFDEAFWESKMIKALELNCLDCKFEDGKLSKIKDFKSLNEMLESNYLLAKYYSLNNGKKSISDLLRYYENCLKLEKDLIVRQRSNTSIYNKLMLSNFRSKLDMDLLGCLYTEEGLESNHERALFSLIERKRSTILSRNLKAKQEKQELLVSDSMKLKIESLKLQVQNLRAKNHDFNILQKYSPAAKSTRFSLEVAEQRLNLLKSDFSQIITAPIYNTQLEVSLDEVQTTLSEEDLLINYNVDDSLNYVFAIQKQKVILLALMQTPDSIITQFRNSLNPETAYVNMEENYRKYIQSAHAIYQSQLKPVLDHFPETRKIYVIPDGQLHHIPFEALISELPADTKVNYKNLSYLIKDYTFSYANSATTLFKTKSLLNRLEASDNKVLAFAPSYNPEDGQPLAKRAALKQPLSSLRGALNNLNWNDEEVSAIGQYFAGETFVAGQAHEQDFKDKASEYDVLHLSMHAIVDAEDPMYSYLAFAPDPQDTATGDGYLHAFEIYDMDLNAEMAVLSACNTGFGKLYKGEGPMSLAKAFTYAGCPSVVMSYWPADDRSSSEIMAEFYKNLAEGMNKDEALRLAKLHFLQNASPTQQSPAYWNNFVVMGDVSPLVKDRTMLYLSLIGGAVLLLITIVLSFAALRKRAMTAKKDQ